MGTRKAAPQADIVHDRFHASKPLNEAVDQTRREESANPATTITLPAVGSVSCRGGAKLAAEGDDTLKHTRFLWLHGTVPDVAPGRLRGPAGTQPAHGSRLGL